MKIRLTEGQMERLKAQMNEDSSSTYNREVKVRISGYGATYQGKEIDDVIGGTVRLTYNINIEGRSWGIKGISLYNINGPSEIDAEISYFNGVDDDTQSENITLPINWEAVNIEEEKNGLVTVGDEVDVELTNDNQGNLVVKTISLVVYTL
jgi:hypothetical protein